ncbi:MAG: SWIM zinc finger family protein [Anaerolineae bacterium]|nr:SWIM zinc finger family protein [Anaerolineae bacterium]
MGQKIVHVKEIQKRSRRHGVQQLGPNWFKVRDSESHRLYDVNVGLNGGTCTCSWGRYRPPNDHRSGCTHVIAALNYRAMRHSRRVSVWSNEQDARRQHRPILSIGDGLLVTTRPN